MTTFTITVGLKPSNHPFYGRGSKFCFYIDNVPGKQLVLTSGTNYTFNINTSGYPFYFTTSESGGSEDNSVLLGFSPTDKGTVQFTLPSSYPATFYYQCKIYPYMGNAVSISHNTFYVNPILTGLVAPTSLASPDSEHIYVAD